MRSQLVFLIGCIGTRLAIAYIVKNMSLTNRKYLAIPVAITSLAFIILYLFDLRKTGLEAGGRIWWNKIRPVHGLLLAAYSIYAFKEEQWSWIILVIDVLLGLGSWLSHTKLGL